MTIGALDIYSNGDPATGEYLPGMYTVRVRGLTMNFIDTGAFKDLTVTVEDPCLTATLKIDSTVFLDTATSSLVQVIGYPLRELTWTESVVQFSSTIAKAVCSPYLVHEVINRSTMTAPDSNIFNIQLTLPTKTL